MSVSIHMNGRTRGEIRPAIVQHQIRADEQTGKDAKAHTDSAINPALSAYNVRLHHEPDLLDTIRQEHDQVNQARLDQGKRKLRADANIMLTGTIQLSDDSLQALGWRFDSDGVKLPVDQQPDQAVKNVTMVYQEITRSVMAQPERYGRVRSATLHYDETSPHVDLISDPLDAARPDRTARTILNGSPGAKRGQAMREMQDHLCDHVRYKADVMDRFGLHRGDSQSKRVDRARKTRQAEQRLKRRESRLNERESRLNVRESRLNVRESRLNVREGALDAKADKIRQDSTSLDTLRQTLEQQADELKQREKQIKENALKLQKMNQAIEQKKAGFAPLIRQMKDAKAGLDRSAGRRRSELKQSLERAEQIADRADDWLSSVESLGIDQPTKGKGMSL